MILDNPEVGGQSESHLHPVLGGMEIEIENTLQLGGRNSHPIVADSDKDHFVGRRGSGSYLPFLCDGLQRVLKQVHDDLVQLASQVEQALSEAGKDVQLTVYPPFAANGHELFFEVREPYWSDVLQFLDTNL